LRGQPLVALLAVLGGWVGGRAVAWQPLPEPAAIAAEVGRGTAPSPIGADGRAGERASLVAGPQSNAGEGYVPGPEQYLPGDGAADAGYAGAVPVRYRAYALPRHAGYARAGGAGFVLAGEPRSRVSSRGGFGSGPTALFDLRRRPSGLVPREGLSGGQFGGVHGGLFDSFANLAGLSHHYVPQVVPSASAAGIGAGAAPGAPVRARRWWADAWAMVRRGSGGQLTPGVLPASYGASQAGAVLRFRLARGSGHRPNLYMRTTSTLGGVRESAAALGFSARPLPSVPVVAAVEGRLTQAGGRNVIQPVAMVITELPPITLPLDLRAEVYAQGGYVGGKYATPFADGQVRIDHGLFRLGPVETRLGGGVWGGIQKGASRLDVGPTATLAFPLGGQTYGRLAFDWRFRVAGDAVPGSGPAVTLSAGF